MSPKFWTTLHDLAAPRGGSIPQARAAVRAVGGALGIAIMTTLANAAGEPLMTVPFATSIVLVMGSPEAPPASPRAVAGGHILSALAGLACASIFGDAIWVPAVGVGLAIVLMHLAGAFHPPAGISPLVIAQTHPTPLFLVSPILIGTLILIGFAFVYHRLSGDEWPSKNIANPPNK